MSILLDKIKLTMNESLKKGDSVRVATLRFVISGAGNAAITKYGAAGVVSVTDADVLDVIKKLAKTHKESIEAFAKANRQELVDKENAELAILEEFLPKEMTDEDLKTLLAPVAASGEANFGLLMKAAMAAVKGQADGGRVSTVLRSLLPKA
jgi:hypothetical protein